MTGFDAITQAVEAVTEMRPTHGAPRAAEYASLLINELRKRGFRVTGNGPNREASPELFRSQKVPDGTVCTTCGWGVFAHECPVGAAVLAEDFERERATALATFPEPTERP